MENPIKSGPMFLERLGMKGKLLGVCMAAESLEQQLFRLLKGPVWWEF